MSRLFNWGPIEEKVELPVDKVADLEQLLLTSQVALYLSLSFSTKQKERPEFSLANPLCLPSSPLSPSAQSRLCKEEKSDLAKKVSMMREYEEDQLVLLRVTPLH